MNLKTSAGLDLIRSLWEGIEEMRMNADVSAPRALEGRFREKALGSTSTSKRYRSYRPDGMLVFINGA